MEQDSKKRFKMYKSGKVWLYAPIVFLSFGGAVMLGEGTTAHADQVPATNTQGPSSDAQTAHLDQLKVRVVTASAATSMAPTTSAAKTTSSAASSTAPTSVASTANSAASTVPVTSVAATTSSTAASTTSLATTKNSTSTSVNSTAPKASQVKSVLAAKNVAAEATAKIQAAAEDGETQFTNTNLTSDNFKFNGNATLSNESGQNIVTLTQDKGGQAGNVTLSNLKISFTHDFNFDANVYLGDHIGADGISFFFHPDATTKVGDSGNSFGIGGFSNAFGFKLDTYGNGNNTGTNHDGDGTYDGGRNTRFGSFIFSNAKGVVYSYGVGDANASNPIPNLGDDDTAGKAQTIDQPNGKWTNLTMSYVANTKTLSASYTDQDGTVKKWSLDLNKIIDPAIQAKLGTNIDLNNNYAFGFGAGTGFFSNTQKV